MKNTRTKEYCGLALATLLVSGASLPFTAAADLIIQDFGTNADGAGVEWGSSAVALDTVEGNPAGSLALTVTFASGSDSPMVDYVCAGGGNPWNQPVRINFSQYRSIEFDLKWDPTSDLTVAQFNDPSTWPLTLTNSLGHSAWQPGTPAGYLYGRTLGLEIELCGGPAGQQGPSMGWTNIPAAAASGWVHIVIPINPALPQIDGANGIVFHKWINQNWGLSAEGVTARFWIDNVTLEATCSCPLPPPVLRVEPASPAGGYWLFWTLPAYGFELQATTNLLTGPWYDPGLQTNYVVVGNNVQVLVPAESVVAGQCYWRLYRPAP